MSNSFKQLQQFLLKVPYFEMLLSSIAVVFAFFVINRILLVQFKKKIPKHSDRILVIRKLNSYTRYATVVIVFLMWFSQLQGVFVSLVAVAAAIVIATKELIMCVSSGFLLKSSRVFKVGDRIEIDEKRGFVIETNLFVTKVLEIGPEKNSQQTTGSVITIPNSLFYSDAVRNESYFRGYSIKSYSFKVEDRKKIHDFESYLLAKGEEIIAPYYEDAKRMIGHFCEKEAISIPSLAARTKIVIEENGDIKVLLKIPVRNVEIADTEQLLNRAYVDFINSQS